MSGSGYDRFPLTDSLSQGESANVIASISQPVSSHTIVPCVVSNLQPVVGVAVQQQRAPEDYMGLAIFTTLCCFWPVGIFAILKARDVHKRAWQGDTSGALEASQSARRLSFIALTIGILGISMIIVAAIVFLAIQ